MRSATKNKVGRDPAYLVWIRSLLCLVCFRSSWMEMLGRGEIGRMSREYNCYTRHDTATESAHTGPHGLSAKSPDRTAIPLCANCHREGRYSYHHLGPKRFQETHDLSIDMVVKALNAHYDGRGVGVLSALEVI